MQMQQAGGMPGSNMSPMPSRGGETMPGMSLSAQQQLQEQQQQGKPWWAKYVVHKRILYPARI